jgi:hypothetical protein
LASGVAAVARAISAGDIASSEFLLVQQNVELTRGPRFFSSGMTARRDMIPSMPLELKIWRGLFNLLPTHERVGQKAKRRLKWADFNAGVRLRRLHQ